MKGLATCPNCKHEFVLDLPGNKKHDVSCPNCKIDFTIQAKCKEVKSKDECVWEEHGEPRKTVLSKIKPRTNRPMIAAVLLVCVFVLGITTAVFSEQFIESTLSLGSNLGLDGDVIVTIQDFENNSIDNVTVTIGNITGVTNENGTTVLEKATLGIQTVGISKEGYNPIKNEILIMPFIDNEVELTIEEGSEAVEYTEFDNIGCMLIMAIFSVFPLLSLISCFKRRNFDIAIAGSGIGIFSFGFFFIGSVLGIIAFLLIYKSRDEFRDGKKGKTF